MQQYYHLFACKQSGSANSNFDRSRRKIFMLFGYHLKTTKEPAIFYMKTKTTQARNLNLLLNCDRYAACMFVFALKSRIENLITLR